METLPDKPGREVRTNEISLKEFILKLQEWLRYIASKWRLILLAGIIGGLAGYYYAVIRKTNYIATSTFVLDEQGSRGGLSQYAGLASMMGVDLGGGGGGIFQGDNIIELYRSGSILKATLLSSDEFDGKKQLLLERYIEFNKLKERWAKKPELQNLSFRSEPFNRLQDSVLNDIIEDINENYLFVGKPDKKLSVLKVEVKARDELFAKSFNDLIVKNVSDYYIQTRTKRSLENVSILQHQADSIRAALSRDISNTYKNGIPETFRIDQTKHSLFGASKVAGDISVQEYGRYFNMPTVCLRGGCLTGPNHSGVELHGFLSYLIKCNLEQCEYTVYGYKGKQVRDNIHSYDVACFIDEFIKAPRVAEVYNLGGGKNNTCSVLEAFDMISAISGKQMIYKYKDECRVGDHICYYSDLRKMMGHYPNWQVSKLLPSIFQEIYNSWMQRNKKAA